MATSCTIKADLSAARLAGNGPAQWSAPPAIAGQAATAETLRARTQQAADWLAGAKKDGKRLALVCIDVDSSSCLWLRSPSAESPVLNATLRNATQDWGESLVGGSAQRLVDAVPAGTRGKPSIFSSFRRPVGKTGMPAALLAGCPVLCTPSALVRLWLDELDARGIRADSVMTLWHAMAAAWRDKSAAAGDVTAIILLDSGVRAVWCWSRGADLIVGGSVREESSEAEAAPPEPNMDRLAGRLALDWLTWSAHLGVSPSRTILVGDEAEPLRARLAAGWPTMPVLIEPVADSVQNTVNRAAETVGRAACDASNPRRCLVALTQRPTRAVRTQYRWAAAALVLLAAALGVLGFRMTKSALDVRSRQAQVDEESRSLVQRLNDPKLADSSNILKTLESEFVKLKNLQPPKPPPAPKPMRAELLRLGDVLAKYEGVRLVQIQLDMKAPSKLQLTVPDRRTGEEIRLALQQGDPALDWREGGNMGSDQSIQLTGTWVK